MRPAEQSEIPAPHAVRYKEPGLFYGWYIVAAGFVSLWIHAGIGFYSFPVFFVEFFEQLGWKRGETATGFSIAFIVGGLTSPIVGRLIPRYGPKVVVVTGALIMSAAFVLFSLMQTLWQYYLICFLLAIGWCCTGAIATSFAVSDWFNRKRGTAMGVMMVGVGLGGLVCVPLTRLLVNQFEWRTTFGIYAVSIIVLLVPVAAAILKPRPPEVLPDGEATLAGGSVEGPEESAAGMVEADWTFRDAARTTSFWIISIAFILAISQSGCVLPGHRHLPRAGSGRARALRVLGCRGQALLRSDGRPTPRTVRDGSLLRPSSCRHPRPDFHARTRVSGLVRPSLGVRHGRRDRTSTSDCGGMLRDEIFRRDSGDDLRVHDDRRIVRGSLCRIRSRRERELHARVRLLCDHLCAGRVPELPGGPTEAPHVPAMILAQTKRARRE
jgi:MFS family permease